MSQTKACWNCQATIAITAAECPVCSAGFAFDSPSLSPEDSDQEHKGLPLQDITLGRATLGCLAIAGLVLAGIVTGVFIAAIAGFSADSQPCTGSAFDCGEYVGITTGLSTFLWAAPISSAFYIWLASRSLAKRQR